MNLRKDRQATKNHLCVLNLDVTFIFPFIIFAVIVPG